MASEPCNAESGVWTDEEKDRLLPYLKQSLDREKLRRDEIAEKHGWTIHPNDMELSDAEREVVLLAWRLGAPQPYADRLSK